MPTKQTYGNLLRFLGRKGFVVLTSGGKGHEAWAYEGPLDFDAATPVRFGLADTPAGALEALDWQLGALARALPAPMAEPIPLTTPGKRPHHDHLQVDPRELATILAALRYHQAENLQGESDITDLSIRAIATDGGTLQALSTEEIDTLCQRLNAGATIQRARLA